jgi:hypothetical protein
MELFGGAVGLLLGALLMGTLKSGVVMFIECVSLLLALEWGVCMFAIVCTLGTHCTGGGVCRCSRVIKLVGLCLYDNLGVLVLHQLFVVDPLWSEISVCTFHALDSFDKISQCVHHFVGMCDGGIGDAFVLELHCVGQSFALGVFDVAVVCAIMFW